MEEKSLEPIAVKDAPQNTDSFETLDYVKELFLHAVEQQKNEKKRLRTARITMILIACILAVLIIVAFVLVPPIQRAIGEAQAVLIKVNALDLAALSKEVTGLIAEANTALTAVGDAAKQLETLDIEGMNTAIDSLTKTVDSFSKLDIATLNKAIQNLNNTIAPLAKFFGRS